MFYIFPDNTVLSNFASVDKVEILRDILRGRGRWVEAIAFEVSRSARIYPRMDSIESEGWLDEPITVTDEDEIETIERIRTSVFGGRVEEATRHLGEAQTCYVVSNWPEFQGSHWITDDRDAAEFARRRGITTRDTMDLVSEGVADGTCTRDEGFRMLRDMKAAGNWLRTPTQPSDL